VRPVYPEYPSFIFSLARHIYQLRRLERQKTRKFRLSTYRMNFLFKRILNKNFKTQDMDTGTVIVRFLQPYGLLVGLKKLREIASETRSLARYKRQISYKRLIPYLAILVRY